MCFLPSVDQAFAEADSIIPFSVKMAGDESGTTLGQPHLARQDLSSLVSDRLTDFTASRFYIGGCRLVALPKKRLHKKRNLSPVVLRRHPAHDGRPGGAERQPAVTVKMTRAESITVTVSFESFPLRNQIGDAAC